MFYPQAGGGSGLGLMITKGIVDLHRGSISVYSEGIGKGCTVTIIIPLTVSSSRTVVPYFTPDVSIFVPMSPSMTPKLTETETNSSYRLSSRGISGSSTRELLFSGLDLPSEESYWDEGHLAKKDVQINVDLSEDEESRHIEVLVVDDSKLSRRMLLRYLQSECYTCDEAEDGLVAVQKVLKRSQVTSEECESPNELVIDNIPGNSLKMYDAILMDFMMPVMDGPTATRKIRDMGYEGLILGVTGNALPSDIDLFMGHGADRVLTKPVNVDSLKNALKSIKLGLDLGSKRVYPT